MPNSNQPTRKVKVRIGIRFKPALKTDSPLGEALLLQGLPPGTLAEQIVEIDVPINVSNAALIHDARFVMAVERAKERLMDEMIDIKHEVIQERVQ